ncbi:MAG: hypothetical protein HOO06_13710 [Bdellovibrionaceae bacterium]|jgi:hypothetical protein|nr:hypothetical protein [Pseudobdellovibrionaceae bacterium]
MQVQFALAFSNAKCYSGFRTDCEINASPGDKNARASKHKASLAEELNEIIYKRKHLAA